MKAKRILSTALASTLALAMLAGCSGGGTTPGGATTTPKPDPDNGGGKSGETAPAAPEATAAPEANHPA